MGAIPTMGSLASFIKMLIGGGILMAILSFVGIIIYNKVKYKYQGEVYRRRQDDLGTGEPTAKIVSGKAGYFTKSGGKNVFRIRFGHMPWQKIEISKLPKAENMIGNKVVYLQLNKDNLVQAKVNIDWKGEFELKPVEDDLKYGAQLNMQENNMILEQKRLTPLVAGIMVIGFILVTGIIVFYFLRKG